VSALTHVLIDLVTCVITLLVLVRAAADVADFHTL
jgi:hypothetical protein